MSNSNHNPNNYNSPHRNQNIERNNDIPHTQPLPEKVVTTVFHYERVVSSQPTGNNDNPIQEIKEDFQDFLQDAQTLLNSDKKEKDESLKIQMRKSQSGSKVRTSTIKSSVQVQAADKTQKSQSRKSYHESPPARTPGYTSSQRSYPSFESYEERNSPSSRSGNFSRYPTQYMKEQPKKDLLARPATQPIVQRSDSLVTQTSQLPSEDHQYSFSKDELDRNSQNSNDQFSLADQEKNNFDQNSRQTGFRSNANSQLYDPNVTNKSYTIEQSQSIEPFVQDQKFQIQKYNQQFMELQKQYYEKILNKEMKVDPNNNQGYVQSSQDQQENSQQNPAPIQRLITPSKNPELQKSVSKAIQKTPTFVAARTESKVLKGDLNKSQMKISEYQNQVNNLMHKDNNIRRYKDLQLNQVLKAILFGEKPEGVSFKDVFRNRRKVADFIAEQSRRALNGEMVKDHRQEAKSFKNNEYAQSKQEIFAKNKRVLQLKKQIARVKDINHKIKQYNLKLSEKINGDHFDNMKKKKILMCEFMQVKSFEAWSNNFPKNIRSDSNLLRYVEFNLDNNMLGRFRIQKDTSIISLSIFPTYESELKDTESLFPLSKRATALKSSIHLASSKKRLNVIQTLLYISTQYRFYKSLQKQLYHISMSHEIKFLHFDQAVQNLKIVLHSYSQQEIQITINLIHFNWNMNISIKWDDQRESDVKSIEEKALKVQKNRLIFVSDEIQKLMSREYYSEKSPKKLREKAQV